MQGVEVEDADDTVGEVDGREVVEEDKLGEAMGKLFSDMSACQTIENLLRGKPPPKPTVQRRAPRGSRSVRGSGGKQSSGGVASHTLAVTSIANRSVQEIVSVNIAECKKSRKRLLEKEELTMQKIDDESLSQYAQFTDGINLAPYENFLHYVPRLVNVVSQTPDSVQ